LVSSTGGDEQPVGATDVSRNAVPSPAKAGWSNAPPPEYGDASTSLKATLESLSDNINCNKHKMERFLHHGRFYVASVYAPISFPPLPLIVLKNRDGEQPAIVAVGSLKSMDPDRIILKKIVLTM
jgi:hypothetical protein